jgi:hypothetical protein
MHRQQTDETPSIFEDKEREKKETKSDGKKEHFDTKN